jgi:hypothetical protein
VLRWKDLEYDARFDRLRQEETGGLRCYWSLLNKTRE